MAELSGIESAIKELRREQNKIQEAITMLKRIRPGVNSAGGSSVRRRGRRRLSADARRRISEASKKRWAAMRAKAKAPK